MPLTEQVIQSTHERDALVQPVGIATSRCLGSRRGNRSIPVCNRAGKVTAPDALVTKAPQQRERLLPQRVNGIRPIQGRLRRGWGNAQWRPWGGSLRQAISRDHAPVHRIKDLIFVVELAGPGYADGQEIRGFALGDPKVSNRGHDEIHRRRGIPARRWCRVAEYEQPRLDEVMYELGNIHEFPPHGFSQSRKIPVSIDPRKDLPLRRCEPE